MLSTQTKSNHRIRFIGKYSSGFNFVYIHSSPNGKQMDSSMTTSSEMQVMPSPTKVRMRKSRHKRSNSKGSLSTALSPTKDALHEELQEKVLHSDGSEQTTASYKYFGPHMAITEHRVDLDKYHSKMDNHNLNESCSGCDGTCSDVTCSSKRSSQASADVESNTCDSPYQSPTRSFPNNKMHMNNDNIIKDKDSNENLNVPLESVTESLAEDTSLIITTSTTGSTVEEELPVEKVSPPERQISLDMSDDQLGRLNHDPLKVCSLITVLPDAKIYNMYEKIILLLMICGACTSL